MVYLFFAEGFEDMEAVVPFDLMKRAGIDVTTVGIGSKTVKSAHGLEITADISENELDFEDAEAFVLPGGWPGAKNLKNSKAVNDALIFAMHNDVIVGAICASPGHVLSGTGMLSGKKYTCFPGFETSEGEYTANPVEIDGKLITAKGPDFAKEFALALIEKINGSFDGVEEFLK
ncbi:MAG: DJ-1/PfpI family protein [Oscillospiraceae bacterium]|nr:DJ-1/PfpI family protein [Oscillospiraceae bacterium]